MAVDIETAAKSNTVGRVVPRRPTGENVNDGENRVFPIQVSRQELLLCLGAVIFIGTDKNIFYIRAQTDKSVNNLRFQAQCSPDVSWRFPYLKNAGN